MEKPKETLRDLEISVEAALYYFNRHKTIDPRYLIDVVGKRLAEALKDFFPEIEKRHKIESGNGDEETITVVHYTSIDTVFSMLEKASIGDKENSLRLFDSAHLNDPDEGNYIVRNVPEKYAWLKQNGKRATHAYLASFIINDTKADMSDNLVFWRTYGREGGGCSLSVPIPRSQLKRIIYGSEEIEETIKLLSPVLDYLDPLLKIKKESLRKDIISALAEIVWKPLERFRYLYKSDAYRYENECRLVLDKSDLLDKGKIHFELQAQNNSSKRIRHYYINEKLAVERLLISGSSITLGPCVENLYNVIYCLEELKQKAGLVGAEIKTSKIPYRKS